MGRPQVRSTAAHLSCETRKRDDVVGIVRVVDRQSAVLESYRSRAHLRLEQKDPGRADKDVVEVLMSPLDVVRDPPAFAQQRAQHLGGPPLALRADPPLGDVPGRIAEREPRDREQPAGYATREVPPWICIEPQGNRSRDDACAAGGLRHVVMTIFPRARPSLR
jgi:hypothetical protein